MNKNYYWKKNYKVEESIPTGSKVPKAKIGKKEKRTFPQNYTNGPI
jgi:hypothetical protein